MKPLEIREAVEIPYKPKHAGGRPKGKRGKSRKFASDAQFKTMLVLTLREQFAPNPKRGEKRAEDVFAFYEFVKGYRFTDEVIRYNLHEVLGWHSQRVTAVLQTAYDLGIFRLCSGRMGVYMTSAVPHYQLTTRHDISSDEARKNQGGNKKARRDGYGFGIMKKAVDGKMSDAVALRDRKPC